MTEIWQQHLNPNYMQNGTSCLQASVQRQPDSFYYKSLKRKVSLNATNYDGEVGRI